jgi:hypothetical protein
MAQFDAGAAAALFRRHRITHVIGGDDMFARLAAAADGRPFDSVRFSGCAAFHSTTAAAIAAAQAVGLEPHGLYGSSEVQALFSVAEGEHRLLGGGVPVSAQAELDVRDPQSGRALPFGGLYFALSTAMYGPNAKNLINVTLLGLSPAEGEQAPIMPGFAGALTEDQLAALASYLRRRFSDQPQWHDIDRDIREARSGKRPVAIYPVHVGTSVPGEGSQRGKPW